MLCLFLVDIMDGSHVNYPSNFNREHGCLIQWTWRAWSTIPILKEEHYLGVQLGLFTGINPVQPHELVIDLRGPSKF